MLRRTPARGDFWQWLSGAPESAKVIVSRDREVLEETGLDVAGTIFVLDYRYAYPLRPERRERRLETVEQGA